MNNQQFAQILIASWYYYQGLTEEELHIQFGLDPVLIKAGVKLCNYLKGLEGVMKE